MINKAIGMAILGAPSFMLFLIVSDLIFESLYHQVVALAVLAVASGDVICLGLRMIAREEDDDG